MVAAAALIESHKINAIPDLAYFRVERRGGVAVWFSRLYRAWPWSHWVKCKTPQLD